MAAIQPLGRSSFGDPANSGNVIPLEEAHALLNEWISNDRLRLHMKQVAAVMKAWAQEKEQADATTALKWELAGFCTMLTGKNILMNIAGSSSKNWKK